MPQQQDQERTISTHIPARMDRLPWSKWHWRIIVALGTSWILDGLQVTLAGSLAGILESKKGLGLTAPQVTAGASTYLAGAVIGAIFFGWLTDRLGRRKLFLITVSTYSLATAATALSWGFMSFAIFRAICGLGIGGEYAAINSAVDELIPGKVRGTVDLVINATFWIGASIGSVASLWLLRTHMVSQNLGWRLAFSIGAVLGIGVFILRLRVPESPRWLMLRGKDKDADDIVCAIEADVSKQKGELPAPDGEPLKLAVRDYTPWGEVFHNMLFENRVRSILALVLMVGQSFFFNSVFFTYGLVVKRYYGVSDRAMPLHLLPFALASFFGPLLLGHLFDRVGRKPMIAITYGAAGALLFAIVFPFANGLMSLLWLDISFSVVFFIASSAGSAAYLTVSEIFPLEIRAFAIAMFYAIGTLIGGVGAPVMFGELIQTGSRWYVGLGWMLGAVLMIGGSVCEMFIGVEAAGQSLESVSKPLQSR